MVVAAAICWYAEDPDALARAVESVAGYCDTVVAFGGRWEMFPEVAGDNLKEQIDAIAGACAKIDIDYTIVWDEEWDSQVEKRAELMWKARELSDWVLVVDGDEFVHHGDPQQFRDGLDETSMDVARVFAFRIGGQSYGRMIQRAYRSNTGVTVRTAHNGYVTGDGRFLNGDPCYVDLMPVVDLGDYLSIAHDLTCRSVERKQARASYLRYRRKKRIEAWT